MKKATIIIEVTEQSTKVLSFGITGNTVKTDITGTDAEKLFVKFLRSTKDIEETKQVLDAIDIKKWDEVPDTPEVKHNPYITNCACGSCFSFSRP